MIPIRNLNDKRVMDLSDDGRTAEIRRGNCITTITTNPDGTLHITHKVSEL
jgi:hypothetical protein